MAVGGVGVGVGWRDWEGDQAVKGEGERESKGGREMERESVYNFGKHRKRQQREQTFLSWLLPFGLFHISSKDLSVDRAETREDTLFALEVKELFLCFCDQQRLICFVVLSIFIKLLLQ